MTTPCKCAIVEDEPLAQNILKKYIADHPALELTGVSTTALGIQPLLAGDAVQLLFLDIHLPKLSGINFLRSLAHTPLVILTTAYPEFAVDGFELGVTDYLVKPFSFERFLKAVNKALEQLAKPGPTPDQGFIFLKADKKIHQVSLADIQYIEATGDYARVICTNNQYVVNYTLKNFQEELPADRFIRVHKSYIIARDKIVFFEGNYVKISNKNIPIGASYKDDIQATFKERLF